jgi:hypothetical protein
MADDFSVNETRSVVSVASSSSSRLNASISSAADDERNAQLEAAAIPQFQEPCTLRGLGAAFGSGMLGAAFGFFPSAVRNKGRNWGAIAADSGKSASSFALMGGVYTAVQCLCQRVRQVDDSWNRAAAGCASGIALNWTGGPVAAAQSCAMIGALSYFVGGVPAAEAATLDATPKGKASSTLPRPGAAGRPAATGCGGSSPLPPWLIVVGLQQHLNKLPPLAWLAPCSHSPNSRRRSGCTVAIGSRPQ